MAKMIRIAWLVKPQTRTNRTLKTQSIVSSLEILNFLMKFKFTKWRTQTEILFYALKNMFQTKLGLHVLSGWQLEMQWTMLRQMNEIVPKARLKRHQLLCRETVYAHKHRLNTHANHIQTKKGNAKNYSSEQNSLWMYWESGAKWWNRRYRLDTWVTHINTIHPNSITFKQRETAFFLFHFDESDNDDLMRNFTNQFLVVCFRFHLASGSTCVCHKNNIILVHTSKHRN